MGLFARTYPSASAFPRFSAGRLLRHPFRGLLSVHSRYGLQTRQVAKATLYTGGSSSFVTSATAPIASGWSEPVPGRDSHPLLTSAFSRRTRKVRGRCAQNLRAHTGPPEQSRDSQETVNYLVVEPLKEAHLRR